MTDKKLSKPTADGASESSDGSSGAPAAPTPINLQKRQGEVEATRYGDWELNGRCIDF